MISVRLFDFGEVGRLGKEEGRDLETSSLDFELERDNAASQFHLPSFPRLPTPLKPRCSPSLSLGVGDKLPSMAYRPLPLLSANSSEKRFEMTSQRCEEYPLLYHLDDTSETTPSTISIHLPSLPFSPTPHIKNN